MIQHSGYHLLHVIHNITHVYIIMLVVMCGCATVQPTCVSLRRHVNVYIL